jgi:hypothetical protein
MTKPKYTSPEAAQRERLRLTFATAVPLPSKATAGSP